MSSITHLAPELVIQIFGFVDPPALIDLACTCKALEACSRDLIRKQRDASIRCRVVTDVVPQSLTNILREVTADPSLAWHVRELEVTCARTNWSHWRAPETGGAGDSSMSGSSAPPPPEYAFTPVEEIDLLDQPREIFHFDEHEIDIAREDLQSGNDAPLKLLLLGFCQRIRSLKFTRHFHLTSQGALERASFHKAYDEPRSAFDYFHQAVLIQVQNKSSVWPMGLDSLEDLAIGVYTEVEPHPLPFNIPPYLYTDLMNLPHLASLYCCGLQIQDDDDDDDDNQNETSSSFNVEKGGSSLQHIFLSGAGGRIPWSPAWKAIVSGCKQLRSLTITHTEMRDVDELVKTLGDYQRDSLETLMFYDTDALHGYRCNMFRPEELGGLRNLRMVYADASDVMLDAYYNYEGKVECAKGNEWISDVDFFVEFFLDSAFPKSMEVLVLGAQGRGGLYEGDAEMLDQAIAKMIEDARSVRSGGGPHGPTCSCGQPSNFANLKAVYLGALDETANMERALSRHKPRFAKAIAAGRKFGVDVHTRTTRGQPFHQIEFPKPPITSVSFKNTGLPPGTPLAFDVYTGRWGPPGCGNCGTCTKCLQQYDAGVWKRVAEELEGENISQTIPTMGGDVA